MKQREKIEIGVIAILGIALSVALIGTSVPPIESASVTKIDNAQNDMSIANAQVPESQINSKSLKNI